MANNQSLAPHETCQIIQAFQNGAVPGIFKKVFCTSYCKEPYKVFMKNVKILIKSAACQ
jgi:hypothetical protein